MRLEGDEHTGSEITGPCFSPDGTRLYFSSQRGGRAPAPDGAPGAGFGITYEVTGPFRLERVAIAAQGVLDQSVDETAAGGGDGGGQPAGAQDEQAAAGDGQADGASGSAGAESQRLADTGGGGGAAVAAAAAVGAAALLKGADR